MTKAREIAELGQKLTVDASGNMEFAGNLELGDNNKAIFGAGSDLQIYHTGTNSVIDNNKGHIYIRNNVDDDDGSNIYIQGKSGENSIVINDDSNVELYFDNALKLATTATGIDVTGTVTADGLTVDGDITATGDTFSFTSANAEDPLVILKNTTNDANSARLRFVKDKGAAGADGDDAGEIEFYADNDAQEQILFARIKGEVKDASDGAEGGQFKFQVASHDGEMITALLLADGSAEDEVDVVIGSGSNSITEVSGSLGIGTTNPTAKVHSVTTGNVPSFLAQGGLADFASPDGENMQFAHYNSGTDTVSERMRITSTGNVGIGVVPDAWSGTGAAIQLEGTGHLATANQYAYIGSNYYYNAGWKYTTSSTAAQYRQDSGSHQWLTAASGTADAAISWSEAMRIKSTGDVGIGTGGDFTVNDITGSGYGLVIGSSSASSAGIQIRTGTTGAGNIYFGDNSGSDAGRYDGFIQYSQNTRKFNIGTARETAMVIDSSGNVGIGTTLPSAALEIGSTTSIAGARLTTSAGSDSEIEFINTNSGNHTWAIGQDFSNSNAFTIAYANAVGASLSSNSKVVIDSSGNVGIGIDSPTAPLHVQVAGSGEIARFRDNGSNAVVDVSIVNDSQTWALRVDGASSDSFHIRNSQNSTNPVTIDTSGNVGIGTTPSTPSGSCITIYNSTLPRLNFKNSTTGTASTDGAEFYLSGNQFYINNRETTGTIHFSTQTTERMRILSDGSCRWTPDGTNPDMTLDASGNLLVGTTNTAPVSNNVIGISARGQYGELQVSTDGSTGAPLYLNRKTSDGDIAVFRKDGTTVGSIGASSGDLTIGTTDVAVRFSDSSNQIYPINITTRAAVDGATILGNPAARFKDLYLSGGVYLGGTGAVNFLDDYEEGTWTPAVDNLSGFSSSTIASIDAKYTKIGRQVTLEFEFALNSSSGNVAAGDDVVLTAASLPFTPADSGHATGTVGIQVGMATAENVAMGYIGFAADHRMGILFHTVDGTAVRSSAMGGVCTYFTT